METSLRIKSHLSRPALTVSLNLPPLSPPSSSPPSSLPTTPTTPNLKSRQSFTCTECSRSFQRHQHLLRHQRKHNGERPFVCLFEGCQRGFSRYDNMLQHYACHYDRGHRRKKRLLSKQIEGFLLQERQRAAPLVPLEGGSLPGGEGPISAEERGVIQSLVRASFASTFPFPVYSGRELRRREEEEGDYEGSHHHEREGDERASSLSSSSPPPPPLSFCSGFPFKELTPTSQRIISPSPSPCPSPPSFFSSSSSLSSSSSSSITPLPSLPAPFFSSAISSPFPSTLPSSTPTSFHSLPPFPFPLPSSPLPPISRLFGDLLSLPMPQEKNRASAASMFSF